MKRALALLVLMGALVVPVRADSALPLSGLVSTIELCEQAVCHVAVFFGFFQGQLGANPNAVGTIAVTVNHDPLPEPGFCADIKNGKWEIVTLERRVNGSTKGTLCASNDNTFGVSAYLSIKDGGGKGEANFIGTLDHNFFPPTLTGGIFQVLP